MRRTKLNEELIEQAYELLREGHYNEDVAIALGIAEKTFYNWIVAAEKTLEALDNGEIKEEEISEDDELRIQFLQVVKRASNEAKLEALKNIRKAGKRNWQAEAWFLERKYRHQFGRVQMVEDSSSSEKQKTSLLERMIAGVDAIASEEDED